MTNFIIKKLPYDLSSHAGLALISKYLKRININALAQLKKDGRDVVVEYILAVPAARYGDFAKDLSSLHEAHDSTQEWCGQTQWRSSRLVVAYDPVAAARRVAARDRAIAELIDIGQECGVKLDAQDESQRIGKKKSKGRPMSNSCIKA